MSSDSTGAVGKAAFAAELATGTAGADAGSADRTAAAQEAQPADPWFAVGPRAAADADGAAGDGATRDRDGDGGGMSDDAAASVRGDAAVGMSDDAAGGEAPSGGRADTEAEWFLRTGRAGLLPDSMTVSWDDEDQPGALDGGPGVQVEAAGSPPWAAEAANVQVTAPPPWENGPWPGPGAVGPAASGARHQHGTGDAVPGVDGEMAAPAADGRWSARTVLVAGLVPLVLPGLVVGILGLRQAAPRSVRNASVLAIGASLAWAVILVLVVAGGSGGSAGGCAGYPAAVHQAYDKAMADLRDQAPASALAVDLGNAASMANASAAAAGQIGVRTALSAMADDLVQARADVVAHRPVPATLRMHLNDDGAAPAGSCTT